MRKIFNSIDIGTYEIKIATIEYYNGKYNVLAKTSVPSQGLDAGTIINQNQVASQLKKAIKNIESKLGTKIDKSLAIVPSDNINITIATSKINLAEDKPITGEIIFSCLQKMLKGNVEQGMEVVNVFPIEYNLDNKKVNIPIGEVGTFLEVKGILVTVPRENISKTVSIIESLGIEVIDIALSSFSNYYAIKNKELDSKVTSVIDIGEEKTIVSVFNKGIIIKENILPIGTKKIEESILFNYKLDDKNIKNIKENFATANRKYSDSEDIYIVKDRNNLDIKINQYAISEIVEKNIVDILKKAKNEINNLTNREIGYIIITGGITNLLGFNALVEDLFIKNAGIINIGTIGMRNNKYSAVYGSVKYFVDKLKLREKEFNMFKDENIDEMLATRKKIGSNNVLGRIFDKFFD